MIRIQFGIVNSRKGQGPAGQRMENAQRAGLALGQLQALLEQPGRASLAALSRDELLLLG